MTQQTLLATGGKAKGSGGIVTFTAEHTQESLSGNGKTVRQKVSRSLMRSIWSKGKRNIPARRVLFKEKQTNQSGDLTS